LPGSGAVSALRHFGTKTRPRGRARRVTSDATDSDAAGIDSGERSDTCRAERSQLRSKRPQCGEQDMTRAVGPVTGPVTTSAITAGTVPVMSSAGSRPQVTATTAPFTAFTAPVTATTETECGQRVRNPRRRRPPEQRLSPGRAGGTKAEHHLVDSALLDVVKSVMIRTIYMLYQM
jgi:hypothetical protein